MDSGRATGVRLADGETIAAGRLIVSSVDLGQLVQRLLGTEAVGPVIYPDLGLDFRATVRLTASKTQADSGCS